MFHGHAILRFCFVRSSIRGLTVAFQAAADHDRTSRRRLQTQVQPVTDQKMKTVANPSVTVLPTAWPIAPTAA